MKKFLSLLLLISMILQLLPSAYADAAVLHGYADQQAYEYVTFGSYPTDADGAVQPILWRVLRADAESAYLLTEYLLEAKQLHHHYNEYESWETSDLFVYLNGDFKSAAFTAAEQMVLVNKTEDSGLVTLISGAEMRDESIGFKNDEARKAVGTEYGKASGLYIYHDRSSSPWWSRTRSTDNKDQQRRVMGGGKTGRIAVTAKDLGMRPAINIDLNMVHIASGSGSMEDPYVLVVNDEVAALVPAETPAAESQEAAVAEEPIEEAAAEEIPAQPESVTAEEQPEEITPEASAEPDAEELPDETEAASEEAAAAEQDVSVHVQVIADTEHASPLFPALAEDGFLPEGEEEFVHIDDEAGLWLYASQTLRIEIHRHAETEPKKLRWYEAEIYCKPESDMFRMYALDKERYLKYNTLENPQEIAKQHGLVFATNGDFFIYRVGRRNEESGYRIGIVIRDGELFYDIPRNLNAVVYPPLHVMALYDDGNVKMFRNAETTGEALLADGARDALSFGPILVENGEVTADSVTYGEADNPRLAFGMVEPGHYWSVLVEGRMKNTLSAGCQCIWLAELMQDLGCESAINLDGGQTACMIFMGNRINKIGTYDGKTTDKDREQNEVMGIGFSEKVGQ